MFPVASPSVASPVFASPMFASVAVASPGFGSVALKSVGPAKRTEFVALGVATAEILRTLKTKVEASLTASDGESARLS
jgi:hypothetical protein